MFLHMIIRADQAILEYHSVSSRATAGRPYMVLACLAFVQLGSGHVFEAKSPIPFIAGLNSLAFWETVRAPDLIRG
jgi:hypothetical protein